VKNLVAAFFFGESNLSAVYTDSNHFFETCSEKSNPYATTCRKEINLSALNALKSRVE
jgi:hypothetical protein